MIVSCPQCERKLKVPQTCDGPTVRCPVCATTFALPGSGTPRHGEAVSTQPRAPLLTSPTLHPDPDYPDVAPDRWVRSDVDRGLTLLISGQGYELVLQGTGLVLALLLFLSNLHPFTFRGDQFLGCGICLRWLLLFVAWQYVLRGLLRCQSSPVPGPARAFAIGANDAFCFAYLLRVFCPPLLVAFVWNNSAPVPLWVYGLGWATLLTLLVAETLFVLFLSQHARHVQHTPTLTRLRWLVALLVADYLLQVTLLSGLFLWCLSLIERVVPLDDRLIVHLYALLIQLARVAVVVQLLRVLHAARDAGDPPLNREEIHPDYP